jgi:hypothetical protein
VSNNRRGSWCDYHKQMFPSFYSDDTSPFLRWKAGSTGANIAQGLWEARERQRQLWQARFGDDPEAWPIAHPPVVLWMPYAADAACLACTWITPGAFGDPRLAGNEARAHALAHGADASLIQRLRVPVSSRRGPTYPPCPMSWV